MAHGHEPAAKDALARAIAWYGSRPESNCVANRRGISGLVLLLAGRLGSADSVFQELYEEHPDNVDYIGLLGRWPPVVAIVPARTSWPPSSRARSRRAPAW